MRAIWTRRVDSSIKNRTMKRLEPLGSPDLHGKKSAATIRSQCWVRKSFQVVFRIRSGAGSIALRFRMLAIVAVCQFMAEIGQRALNSHITPTAVLTRQTDDQLFDLLTG